MISLLLIKTNKIKQDNLNRLTEISKLYKRLSLYSVFNQTYKTYTAIVCFVYLIEYTMQTQPLYNFKVFC